MSEDNSFFAELQTEFLTESAFLLESYEESMMSLESGAKPSEDLSQIFRVAHSVKGGAAAVGLPDLAKFAHVMEDLLSVLRTDPSLVNSNVISLLLQSGDELKKRIASLQQGENSPWDPAALVEQLIKAHEEITGKPSTHHGEHAAPAEEAKAQAPDDFFAASAPAAEAPAGDVANLDLMAELLAQMSPEDRADYEKSQAPAASAPAPAPVPTPVPVEKPKVVAEAKPAAAPAAANAGNGNGGPAKSGPAKKENMVIKVDTGRVDSVLDAVGELVVLKNQIVHDDYIKTGGNVRLEAIVDQLDKAVRELYEKTLSIRMTPLKSLFVKIQRIVRDVSLTLNKPVDLQLVGEETEVERTVFELLGDPLVHLVRNAMDHGVEKPEIRKEREKPATAKVTVSAKQSGGNVIIEIVDDGGGINRDKVLAKAIEKNLVPHGVDPNTMPDEQVFQFIFAPGFSTADKVSDLSGRGVGLDVVKSNLERINGKINIQSKLGHGTTFRLTIPLSTAITDGIVVALEGERYILPIHSIREIVRVMPKDYTEIPGAGKVAKVRECLVPVINIGRTLGHIHYDVSSTRGQDWHQRKSESLSARREETMLVIIESMSGQMAMPVDDVLGQAQVVVKPLATGQDIPEVAGAAILGDGRTVLILDPAMIVSKAAKGGDHEFDHKEQAA
ncbi:chemotaxis protein CheA [Bdellovibrio sp. HCB337]|uniref:chemotaxis protein CheA n=1 Tax=Bdellovibrio sp. HCB337 TaxID=3394358 RepID=UPI0039A5C003